MKKILSVVVAMIVFCFFTGCSQSYQASTNELIKISDPENFIRYQIVLRVDYDRSIARAVDDGHYDWSVIRQGDFPATDDTPRGKGSVTFELLRFNKSMTEDQVFREFDQRGLRPADIRELLAFSAQYRGKELSQANIVALNAVKVGWWPRCGNLMTCSLRYDHRGYRTLGMGGGLNGFVDDCYFLAVLIANDQTE